MKEISVILKRGKETPGKIRFENDEKESVVRDLYIRKEAFLNTPIPEYLVLTIRER